MKQHKEYIDWFARATEARSRAIQYKATGDIENAKQAIREFQHCLLTYCGLAIYGEAWWNL